MNINFDETGSFGRGFDRGAWHNSVFSYCPLRVEAKYRQCYKRINAISWKQTAFESKGNIQYKAI